MQNFKKMVATAGIAFSLAITLSGCERDKEVSRTTKTYEIVKINPPKRFYVDIKDVKTGEVHEHKYVSKRCSDWKQLKIGSTWEFQEVTYQGSKGKYSEVEGVKELCNLIRKQKP